MSGSVPRARWNHDLVLGLGRRLVLHAAHCSRLHSVALDLLSVGLLRLRLRLSLLISHLDVVDVLGLWNREPHLSRLDLNCIRLRHLCLWSHCGLLGEVQLHAA